MPAWFSSPQHKNTFLLLIYVKAKIGHSQEEDDKEMVTPPNKSKYELYKVPL